MVSAEVDNNEGQEEVGGDAVTKVPTEFTDGDSPLQIAEEALAEVPADSNSDEPSTSTANQNDESQPNAEPSALLPPPPSADPVESVAPSVQSSNAGLQTISAESVEDESEGKTAKQEAVLPKSADNTSITQETLQAESEKKNTESTEAATNQSEKCPPYSEPRLSTLPDQVALTEAHNEPQSFSEISQQDDSAPSNAEHNEAELTPQQSSESLATKPTGFMESLTADFAPDTKAMWAQIFGPRYDEGDGNDDPQADNQTSANSPRDSVSSKSSLQAKLDRERKLDEQIQASQQRYRERILRNAAANNMATRRGRTKASRQPKTQPPTMPPFELAGLSLTQVRFCSKKALDETCKCFRHLHAAALEEVEDPVNPPVQGVFVTQWELEHLLRELFDPQDVAESNSRGRKATLVSPLGFEQVSSIAEGVSMNTQLQASWFIPFGQLPQLRSLVMKITKRHLNEEKLAIVSRHLQKQLTLFPLSSKLQSLVVQLSNHHLKEPFDVPIRQKLRLPEELAHDLLSCIAVSEATMVTEDYDDYKNFMIFLPVELIAKTQLSSVICAQRLVFFRFLIEIIAVERSMKSTKSLLPSMPDPVPAKRKTIVGKRSRSSSKVVSAAEPETTVQNSKTPIEAGETASVEVAHGSLPSASESGINETPTESDLFQEPSMTEEIGDECEKPASQLQQQLESAIAQLRQTLPNIDSEVDTDAKIFTLSPAIRATYLAAVACYESVLLMLENDIDVDTAMSGKLKHFIDALQAIQIQTIDQSLMVPTSPQSRDENTVRPQHDAPRFPPPYPESTVPDESDVQSESSTAQTHFPPPYAITTPSYWAFSPSIPETKSSIAKLASKSPSSKAADLRSLFMSKEAPGVGTYDINQGDKLTFQQGPSFSFGLTGGEKSNVGRTVSGVASSASLPKSSTGKPSARSTIRQRIKSSLAFVPPNLLQSENNQQPADPRVHAASQYDDRHLRVSRNDEHLDDLPPHYGEGDGNEAPAEEPEANEHADQTVETEMDRALRLQQRFFMNEFVQQVVSNQDTPSHFVPRTKHNTDNPRRPTKSKPYWATSEVSPGIERLLHRQRRAPAKSGTSSGPGFRPSKRVVKKPPPSPPPRRQLDNDQHLAWAARISELYQPPVPASEQ